MMDILKFLNTVLPYVRKPARYTGGEYNSVLKDLKPDTVRFALVFPDVYEIGMSNHGLEILYSILNSVDWIWAERAYLPWVDMIEKMEEYDVPLFTLESKTPLKDMDVIGISLEYELSYTNVIEILKLSDVPIRAEDRDEKDPIVLGGGPLSANPEPIAPAFDAILVGDGEEAILEIARIVKETRGMDRYSRLKELSKVDGIYVPIFYDRVGRKVVAKFDGVPRRIRRRILKDLNLSPVPTGKILPNVEAVHDRAVVEIMRGCTRGCRFCHAGMVYRPVRERSVDGILKGVLEMLDSTGYEEVSLLSLSTLDYTALVDLVDSLMPELERRKVALAIPSTRVDRFGVEIAKKISGVRKTGLTFAPEAGTQRLRNVINKNITDEDIISTARAALESGWRRIKLYFMMGLPTETEEDLVGIVEMVKKIKTMGFKDLRVAVSVFVPKPHTPFQFARQITPEEAFRKIKLLKRARKYAKVDFHDPKMSFIEGVLSRGGREVFDVVVKVNEMGQIFDEWSELFSFKRWMEAFEKVGLNPFDYVGPFDPNEDFPWDHIDTGVDKKFLAEDYKRALNGETLHDCRWERCYLCGVCPSFRVFNVLNQS